MNKISITKFSSLKLAKTAIKHHKTSSQLIRLILIPTKTWDKQATKTILINVSRVWFTISLTMCNLMNTEKERNEDEN